MMEVSVFPSSYTANYNGTSSAVAASGLFGRLMNDTTSIGGRALEQNYSFLNGYIAEIIMYNRVLAVPEINQVEALPARQIRLPGFLLGIACKQRRFFQRK